MSGLERDQKVNVIRDTTDSLRKCVETFDDAAEVGMEFVAPGRGNHRFAVLRRKDQMVMKAGMGRRHGECWLAPLPGCCFREIRGPVVSLCSTTGYRMRSLRLH